MRCMPPHPTSSCDLMNRCLVAVLISMVSRTLLNERRPVYERSWSIMKRSKGLRHNRRFDTPTV
jgi:hypothetical protein